MSSREVAELTGKRHDNVMRDIRSIVDNLQEVVSDKDAPSDLRALRWYCKSSTYIDEQGKPREQYLLDKETTTILVSGYSPVLRTRVVNRMNDLEKSYTHNYQTKALDKIWKEKRLGSIDNYKLMQRVVEDKTREEHPHTELDVLRTKIDQERISEAELLNELVLGTYSRRYRNAFRVTKPIRDTMPSRLLQAYEALESNNASFLDLGLDREKRKDALDRVMHRQFPDVVMFREIAQIEIEYLECNVDPDFRCVHPSQYIELKADQETLELLGLTGASYTLMGRKMEMELMVETHRELESM